MVIRSLRRGFHESVCNCLHHRRLKKWGLASRPSIVASSNSISYTVCIQEVPVIDAALQMKTGFVICKENSICGNIFVKI